MKKNITKQNTFRSLVSSASMSQLFKSKTSFFLKVCSIVIASVLVSSELKSQSTVLVPYSGNNSNPCGTNIILKDHSGYTGYSNYANGYTVLNSGASSVINLNGPYSTESGWDYIRIFNGVGTGGTLLQTFQGSGTMNYTGTPGQTLTVQFTSDGSVTYPGFSLNVTYSGPCVNTPCVGTPTANSIIVPNYSLCPNATAIIGLASTYTESGYAYQWVYSTISPVGPWTSIPNATLTSYTTTPITGNIYYTNSITCVPSGQNLMPNSGLISLSGIVTNTVTYTESFEGVPTPNSLPNCSWASSALGAACQTYTGAASSNRSARTGGKFAAFNSGNGTFYSNGVQLNAGVTYSAAVYYKTEAVNNYLNWTDLSIKVGPNQSSTGAMVVATTAGPAASGGYKKLSNTFTVATSGIYYVAVVGTYSGAGSPYLVWDDLEVTAPCALNAPALSISATSSTICAGQSVLISAAGAGSFSWSNGSTGNSINVTPLANTNYIATGTAVLTGCSGSISQYITVNPTPNVFIVASNSSICEGGSVNLSASGANTYLWSNTSTGAVISATPMVTTTYSVFGTNSFGCSGTGSQLVTVNPKPTVTGAASSNIICKGESVNLTGSGATSYQWVSNSLYVQGTQVSVSPMVSTVYTVTGTSNNCSNVSYVAVEVAECLGINNVSSTGNSVKVYPNPTNADITIELSNSLNRTIQLIDITGRVVISTVPTSEKVSLNLSNVSNGVYYLKVKSAESVKVVKVVKN